MAPSLTTSKMSLPSKPTCAPTAKPSASATMLMPIIMFTTNFILAPAPTSPRKNVLLPMTSKHGWASSFSALSPAAKMTSWPCSAGPLEPLTGASTNKPPLARTAWPISDTVSTSTVDMSTYFLPAVMPASTPFSPKTTARADSGSAVHAKTMSQASTTALGVAATFAPFCFKSSHFSGLLFHTVTSNFASTNRPAIALPMMPMPK
mmetsp:Transcript_13546/g.40261  ORF Transcript_13546/g.40261 Transcript_13546/m.40261 type:complete len:206 (+) Transcript_13546:331-948(+)